MSEDIQIVFTDIDGVWTDGGMYYTEAGDVGRLFNTRDSGGVLLLCQAGIRLCVISGEESLAVEERMRKLLVSDVYVGVKDKAELAQRICDRHNVSLSQTAYIGDDLNDIPLLRRVGLSACPADAQYPVNHIASIVLARRGGEGAFREFSERILESLGILEKTIERLLYKMSDENVR